MLLRANILLVICEFMVSCKVQVVRMGGTVSKSTTFSGVKVQCWSSPLHDDLLDSADVMG